MTKEVLVVNKRLLIINILRIIFAMIILAWGIMMWKTFPEEIPLHFDASLKPDEYGEKKKFIWLFLYAIAAFIPIPAIKSDDESEKGGNMEAKRSTIMNWGHTVLMSVIFVVMFVLIMENLR